MSDFVEDCRREWKRLRVPDPIANEMAADLAADLREAEADGLTAEDVLGSGVFDPQSFAAAWASARGVIPPALPTEMRPPTAGAPPPPRRSRVIAAVAAFALIGALGAALAVTRSGSAQGLAIRLIRPLPPPAAPFARVLTAQGFDGGPHLQLIGLFLFCLGALGFIVSMLSWAPWARRDQSIHRTHRFDRY